MTWTSVLLGQFVDDGHIDLQTGPFGTQLKASDYTENGTPVINVRNIGFGSLKPDKLEYVPEAVVDRLQQHILQAEDIVFGRKGAVDRHLLIQENQSGWIQGSDCIRLRVLSPKILSGFLSYYFQLESHKKWMLNHCSNKATMASLNQDVIKRISIKLPPLKTQEAIADILSKYDDLIENNRRRIELLEESARLLYREWFVYLRFPGHEHTPIIDGIPEGWEKKKIDQVTSLVKRGITPKYDEDAPGIVINQKCIRRHLIDISLARQQSKEVPEEKLVRFGDVLINSTGEGTLGRVAQFIQDIDNCTVDSHVTIVRPNEEISKFYLGAYFCDLEPYLSTLGRGATNQTELSRSTICDLSILIPPCYLRDEFEKFTSDIFQQVNNLVQSNRKLQEARDILLPRLMSGEIAI